MAAGQPVISVDAKKKGEDRELRAGRPRVAPAGGPGDRVGPTTSRTRTGGTRFPTASTTRPRTPGSSTSARTATPPPWPWSRSAAGGSWPGRPPTPARPGCWSPATPAAPTATGTGPGRPAWPPSRPETGLDITACHFPPGTSKWNKIEHRLFSQITLAWRGRPLTSYDVIIYTIGHVTTGTGLTCGAVLDENDYPTGLEVTDQEMKQVEDRQLTRHEFHGEWNYTLLAAPRPAAPVPDPRPPAPARLLARRRPQPARPHRRQPAGRHRARRRPREPPRRPPPPRPPRPPRSPRQPRQPGRQPPPPRHRRLPPRRPPQTPPPPHLGPRPWRFNGGQS